MWEREMKSRILVVDDEESIREFLEIMLKKKVMRSLWPKTVKRQKIF